MDNALVIAATDGSSLGNPGPAGWAWYVDEDTWAAGGFARGTNQMAELFAVLAVLRAVPADRPLLIRADSEYTLKICTTWMKGWKARGWRKSDGGQISNLEIIQEIDMALSFRVAPTRFEWVRGHSGDHLNEHADTRCTAASTAMRSGGPVQAGPGWSGGPSGRTGRVPARAVKGPAGKPGKKVRARDEMPPAGPVTVRRVAPGSRPVGSSAPVSPLRSVFASRDGQVGMVQPAHHAAPPSRPTTESRHVEDLIPESGTMCSSCGGPINPFTFECRCSS